MAGLAVLAVLLVALGFLIGQMVPTIGRVQWEMSLTPTPEPDAPASVLAVTPDPAAPTAEPMLRTGSKGQEVIDLQSRLAVLGYYDKSQVDGAFGAGTKEAVIAFQKANGLRADGIVGSETKEVLFSPNAIPYTAPQE